MGGGVIGGVTVANEFKSLVFGKGSGGFGEGDESITGSTGIRNVIGVDGTGCGTDGEPGIIPSILNADIRFITGDGGIERAFMMHVEFVAEDSSEIGVVQNGLMGDGKLEDVVEHVGRHSCTEAI